MVMPTVQADDIDWMKYAGSEITILMPERPALDGKEVSLRADGFDRFYAMVERFDPSAQPL